MGNDVLIGRENAKIDNVIKVIKRQFDLGTAICSSEKFHFYGQQIEHDGSLEIVIDANQ